MSERSRYQNRRTGRESYGEVTRRGFMRGLGAFGVVVASYAAFRVMESARDYTDEHEHSFDDASIEAPEFGEQFAAELAGYITQIRLKHNEIIFLDERGAPVGTPIDFCNALPDDDEHKVEDICISPPGIDWRTKVKEELESDTRHTGRTIKRSLNVALIFKSALDDADEPDLKDGILGGSIATYEDIVQYFAEKKVLNEDATLFEMNGKSVTRADYVQRHIAFKDNVPLEVRDELRVLVPGLCAQESSFNNDSKSHAGAVGIFQFMPATWGDYDKNEENIKSLKRQVEAAGRFLSDMYTTIIQNCNTEALIRARSCFASEEAFLIEFITPLIINSYNAGVGRLIHAVNLYLTKERDVSMMRGHDLFVAVADFAKESEEGSLRGYKEHSREYVPRVYAHAITLQTKK